MTMQGTRLRYYYENKIDEKTPSPTDVHFSIFWIFCKSHTKARENFLYGPLKSQPSLLGLRTFELTYMTSNPSFVPFCALSTSLAI
jgi:hypothetical protein